MTWSFSLDSLRFSALDVAVMAFAAAALQAHLEKLLPSKLFKRAPKLLAEHMSCRACRLLVVSLAVFFLPSAVVGILAVNGAAILVMNAWTSVVQVRDSVNLTETNRLLGEIAKKCGACGKG